MDCRQALEILEVVRPGIDDLKTPELAPAAEHLEDCPECEATLQYRQALDRNLAAAMQDVAVPDDLKQRLLAALAASESDDVPAGSATPENEDFSAGMRLAPAEAGSDRAASDRRISRRRWLQIAATGAAGVLIAAGWLLWRPTAEPTVSLLVLQQSAPLGNFDELGPFSRRFDARLPAGSWQTARNLEFSREIKGAPVGARADLDAALYQFTVSEQRRPPVTGYLLVMDAASVSASDRELLRGASSFGTAADLNYRDAFAAVAWVEADLIYVCFVPAGGGMDSLREALRTRIT